MKSKKCLYHKEHGLTLVEVLVSIVIISLILLTVVNVLTQTMKMNKTSEKIIDATYVVQQEMEKIYKYSLETNAFNEVSGYTQVGTDGTWVIYEKDEIVDYLLEIKLAETEDSLVRIVISAFDEKDESKTKAKAKMEALMKWENQDEATP